MKYRFMVAAVMVMAIACHRATLPLITTPLSNTEVTNTNGQTILLGHASLSVLQKPGYKNWFDEFYQPYSVDTASINSIQPLLKNKRMDIFLGSWCGDSKREVPRMLKILDKAGMDTGKITLVFVDNATNTYKQSPQHEERGRGIHHVPTFILYDATGEMGRIVESPEVSLEKDLLAILQKESYQPKYRAITYWQQQINMRKQFMKIEELQNLVQTIKPLCLHYGEFNAYAYVLLAANENAEALNVGTLNTLIYPNNASVFDSLGEILEKLNDKRGAIAAYEKAILLNPGHANAVNRLKVLKL